MSAARQVVGLVGWLVLSFGTAAVGAAASVNARVFYTQLQLPEWAPPSWVFGPVWSVLYLCMAVAAWWIWRERGLSGAVLAHTLFVAQLIANALWSWLFFGWHKGALASVEVVVLWGLILSTLIAFWRIKRCSGVLLIPYLAWVTFATLLCFVTWRMNPESLGG